jgi:hypothetical protein
MGKRQIFLFSAIKKLNLSTSRSEGCKKFGKLIVLLRLFLNLSKSNFHGIYI